MTSKNYNAYLFFVLLLGVSVLVYFVVAPFLAALVMAALTAQIFYFGYKFLLKLTGGRRGTSSAVACVLVALMVLVPLSLLVTSVATEIRGVLAGFSQNPQRIGELVQSMRSGLMRLPLAQYLRVGDFLNQELVMTLAQSVSKNALAIVEGTYLGVAGFIFSAFIFFFSLFYLFVDGEKFVNKILELIPVKKKYRGMLVKKFSSIARATVRGTILVAILQGAAGTILFLLTGVASPILLGILMAIVSVVPSIGSGLVWLPVGVVMLLLGNIWNGIIILAVGAAVIGTVDNILRQKLIGQDAQMHPLLILFSTLGGIALFGMAGFLIGPILMALFLALWEIYLLEFKGEIDQ